MPFQVRRLCGVLGVSDRPQHTVGETEQAPAVRTAPSAVAGTDPSSNITGVPPTTPRGHASPHAEPSGYIPAGQPTHRTYPHHDKRHSCHRAIVDGNDVKYGIGGNNKSVTYRFYIPLKRTTPPPPPPKLSFPRRPTDCCSGTLNAPETRQGTSSSSLPDRIRRRPRASQRQRLQPDPRLQWTYSIPIMGTISFSMLPNLTPGAGVST